MTIPDHPSGQPLADHLRRMRLDRDLTLQGLADRSGISRATLSRIENGEVSPTAETLGQLATAFAAPISHLLAPLETRFEALVRAEAQTVWEDSAHDFKRRNVSPPAPHFAFELIEARLGPGQTVSYGGPALTGQEHHLLLLEGRLWVTVGGTRHALNPGDCLRYRLAGPSCFETADASARYLIAASQESGR